MLDIVFVLDRIPDVIELLEIDQSLQTVSLGEAVDKSRTMFEYAANKITCHADIEDAIRSVGQNVNIAACHADSLQDVDGRDKPGHDELKDID